MTRPVSADELRMALRKEMGWSDYEVDDFIAEHRLLSQPPDVGEHRCRFVYDDGTICNHGHENEPLEVAR